MFDQEIADLIAKELKRQQEGLELIPSENYVSSQVLKAMGSVLTNKYSEGYPGKRYYGGQENTDKIETIAIERAKKLFGADHANVQPHSGAQANEAAYHSWLDHGDTILGMKLDHGGHLTHGHPVTVLARQYRFVRYGVTDKQTCRIDYDELRKVAKTEKPKIILVGASAYPLALDYQPFADIAKEVGAILMADIAHTAGLIAGGVLANPFDYGFNIVTTTTHKTLRGPRGGMILSKGKVGNPLVKVQKTVENIPTLIDRTVFPGMQGGPLMHTITAKAVAFHEALQPDFKIYAQNIVKNCRKLADELLASGVKLVGSGTENHLILIDVMESFGFDGSIAEKALDEIGLNANKNTIPFDTQPPFKPSGLRLGTAAMTTRGCNESDMVNIAKWMIAAIKNHDRPQALAKIRQEVKAFAVTKPMPA